MQWIIVSAALTLLLVSACGPLVELEDENLALRSHVDSLEIVLAECRGQGDLLHERLSAIESENLQLDDRNRELSARVVEMQHTDPSASAAAARAADESIAEGQGIAAGGNATVSPDPSVPSETRPVTAVVPTQRAADPEAMPPGERLPTPTYNGSTSAGFDFLRQYQAALNAYNDKQYAESMRLFSNLLSGSAGNDMTDNCVYWMGEAAVQLGQQARAKALFTTVIGYRGADKVDDALVSRASVFAKEGNTAAARSDLNVLLKEYPNSEHLGIARQMLRNLR